MSFVHKKSEKEGVLTAGRLTWRAGPVRGCDATLRPRGRAARGPRKVQVAQTRGRRQRRSTWAPVRGATWREGGLQVKGPPISGLWL